MKFMSKYKYCFDLDGTICEIKKEHQDYSELKPLKDSVKILKKLNKNGHYIIIYTARRMRTHDNDIKKVIDEVGELTIETLRKYEIPYDELHFGKPVADYYIDDKGYKLETWNKLSEDLGL